MIASVERGFMKPPVPMNKRRSPKVTPQATAPRPEPEAGEPLTSEERATKNGQKMVDSMNETFMQDPDWEVPTKSPQRRRPVAEDPAREARGSIIRTSPKNQFYCCALLD